MVNVQRMLTGHRYISLRVLGSLTTLRVLAEHCEQMENGAMANTGRNAVLMT